jgi:Thioredoxin like C-terminal domain
MCSFSENSNMLKRSLLVAARKESVMTMGPARQVPALSAALASVLGAQKWVSEAGTAPVAGDLVTVNPKGPEVSADLNELDSPQSGHAKARGFVSSGGIREDVASLHHPGPMLPVQQLGPHGCLDGRREFATLNDKSGAITYRFHARDVNLVLTAPEGRPVRFRVKIDGAAPGADHGTDVDANGSGSVQEPLVNRGRSRIAPSRSNSSIPACAPMSSRSDRAIINSMTGAIS